jgi:hypothetical protein
MTDSCNVTSAGRVTLLLISAPRRPDICGSAAAVAGQRTDGKHTSALPRTFSLLHAKSTVGRYALLSHVTTQQWLKCEAPAACHDGLHAQWQSVSHCDGPWHTVAVHSGIPDRRHGNARIAFLDMTSCRVLAAASAADQWLCSPKPAGPAAADPAHPTRATQHRKGWGVICCCCCLHTPSQFQTHSSAA